MRKQKKIWIFVIMVIAMGMEIFFFNYAGIRTFFKKNREVVVDYQIYDFVGNEYDHLNSQAKVISIPNINFPVSSITFYYQESPIYTLLYKVSYSSISSRYTTNYLADKVMTTEEKNYINFDTTSDCKNMNVTILTNEEIDLAIDKIVLNEVHIHFSIVRVLFIFFFLFFLKEVVSTQKIFQTVKKKDRILLMCLIIIFLILLGRFYWISTQGKMSKISFSLLVIFMLLLKMMYDQFLGYLKLENGNRWCYYLGYFLIFISSNVLFLVVEKTFQMTFLVGLILLNLGGMICLFIQTSKRERMKKWLLGVLAILLGSIASLSILFAIFFLPIVFFSWKGYFKESQVGKNVKKEILKKIAMVGSFCMISWLICWGIKALLLQEETSIFKWRVSYDYQKYPFQIESFVTNMLDYFVNPPSYSFSVYPYVKIQNTTQEIFKSEKLPILGMVYVPIFWTVFLVPHLLEKKELLRRSIQIYAIVILGVICLLAGNQILLEEYAIVFQYVLSLFLTLALLKWNTNHPSKESIRGFMMISVLSFCVLFPIGLSTANLYLQDSFNPVNQWMQKILSFWM